MASACERNCSRFTPLRDVNNAQHNEEPQKRMGAFGLRNLGKEGRMGCA